MNDVQIKANQLRSAIVADLGSSQDVSCLIPGWQPVDLQMGLRWIEASIFEGFNVAYRINHAPHSILHLKKWEFGEDEPSWPQ